MEYAIHLFNAGGVVMYPLVLFMLAACTILFERIRMYRRIDSEIQQLSSSIEAGRNANDWIALEQAIKNNDDALSQFVTPIVDSVYNFEGLENRLHDVVGYMDERLKKQLDFILEADKVKNIMRQTYLADGKRKENDAEHSWHLALMAVLLKEYAPEEVDLSKVIPMVLIHDLVEIDAGDTYAYDAVGGATQHTREEAAAQRIYGLLPEDQGKWLYDLWEEFEAYETPEAKYAHMLDNSQPLFLNNATDGISWVEHGVKKSQIYTRNRRTGEGAPKIWEYMQELIDQHVEKGHVIDDMSKKE